MSDPVRQEEQPHDEAETLLPWYATGQLEASDRLLVERHLSSCAGCRQQLIVERRLIREFRGMAPEVDAGWARLRSRVQPRHGRRNRASEPKRRGRMLIRHPAVAGLAAAQLAVLVGAGAWLLSLNRPDYRALGSAPAPAAADVIVIFRSEATEQDVRTSLRAANASIVDGPTDADAYLLHVPLPQREQALARLQRDRDVQMAQPIDGAVE